MHNRIKLSLVVLILLTGIVGLRQSYRVTAQRNPLTFRVSQDTAQDPRDRLIEKKSNSAFGNEPVELTVIRTKKTNRQFGERFKDNDEWLQGLTVTAKNISSRNVVYINVHLSFERPENSENASLPTFVHPLIFGSMNPPNGTPSDVLAPGDSVDIGLQERFYVAIKGALRKVGYPPRISHVKVYLTQVLFDNDTQWTNGYWYQRDPAVRDNWILIGKDGKVRQSSRNKYGESSFTKISFLTKGTSKVNLLNSLQNPCGVPGPIGDAHCTESGPNCMTPLARHKSQWHLRVV